LNQVGDFRWPTPAKRLGAALFLVFLSGFMQSGPAFAHSGHGLERVTLQLKWFHQFQFAGYYAAIEKGFYKEQGLDVTLLERDPATDPVNVVLAGDADYGITDTGLILAAQEGAPVVLLAQIYQHSPLVLMTARDSNLRTVEDLVGKRITTDSTGITDTPILAMLNQVTGSLERFELQPYTFRNEDLIEGKTDALAGYRSDQPFLFQQKGFALNIIDPRDYGIDFYGDNLFTSQRELTERPDRVSRMRHATLRGWRYALQHPQEMIDLILERYNTQNLSRSHLSYQARETIKLVDNDIAQLGSFWPSRFQRIADIYAQLGLSQTSQIPPGMFYDPEKQLLNTEELAWIEQHPTIKVALDPAWAPVEYRNADGDYEGMSLDYLKLLEERLGLKFEVQPLDTWEKAVAAVAERRADMFASVARTQSREEFSIFTAPYIDMPIHIFAHRDTGYIGDLERLTGQRVAVARGYAVETWLKDKHPDLDLVGVASPKEGLDLVTRGDVDAFVGNALTANYYLRKQQLHEVQIAGDTPYSNRQSMAVRKDWPILAKILEKGLSGISEGQKQSIYNRWMNLRFEREIDYTLIWQITFGAALIIIMALYWNTRLAREVQQRNMAQTQLLEYQETLEQIVDERTAALRSSEARLNEAQRIARLGGWELDMQDDVLSWSDEVFRIFEVDPADFKPTLEGFVEHVHPDDRDTLLQTFHTAVEERQDFVLTHRLLLPDGRIKHVREQGITYYDGQGDPIRCVGTVQDVTEDVIKEQRLRQAATVFNSTVEGVMITDDNANIIDVNEAFTTITGYQRKDVIGQNPKMLASGRHDHDYYQQMWQALRSNGSWSGEIWNRRSDGVLFPELLTISVVRDEKDQASGYVGVFTDISKLKEAEQRLDHLAHHDSLTGIPNRLLLNARLEQSIKRAARQSSGFVLAFIDLDRFKVINDSLGHQAGDELLKQLADRLVKTVRNEDTVGRISGDEFVLILEDIHDRNSATTVVDKVMGCFYQPFRISGQDVQVTGSMGLTLYPQDGTEVYQLMRNADAAMYQAKDDGRNTYHFYTSQLTEAASEHIFLENALREALRTEQFFLAYQPQIELKNSRLTGLEALIRWNHPDEGLISPARFIPIAEQCGLIHDLGAWVLREACQQGRRWLDSGLSFGRIAVNVAGPQIQQGGFNRLVIDTLADTGLSPQHLELEVTESFVMRNLDASIDELQVLRDKGIRIAIDDFGTGYSSLSYLKQLPIDKLKIDQSFVRDIPGDANDMAITEAVIALGGALQLKVIAEGVEIREQAGFLREKGCTHAQGYYFSHPLPAAEIAGLLRTGFAKTA